MKKTLTLSLVLASGFFLTGCFNPVPKTTITGSIGGQAFSLSNPKDTVVSNLTVSVATNGTASLSIGYLESANNSNVVSSAFAGQAGVVKETGDAAVKAFQAGIQAASQSVK
jgi:hypothetical protein